MDLLNKINTTLTAIGSVIAVTAVLIVGISITLRCTGKNKEGFRDVLSSLGGVMTGILVTGSAGAIVAAIFAIGAMLS